MRLIPLHTVGLISLAVLTSVQAQQASLYEKEIFQNEGFSLPYRILYPVGFQANGSYPIVLFLHGSGERGNDNEKQLVHGSTLFLKPENRECYPAIVVFPQCPEKDYWSNVNINKDADRVRVFDFSPKGPPTAPMRAVLALIDSLTHLSIVDKSKVYVGGLSMGGMGTFEIARRRPDLFAAAFPVCGGGDPKDAKRYARKLSFWVFHGAKDNVVPPELSEKMVEAIKTSGGEVRFSLYPEANHNSWDQAFSEPELLPWIFSKSK